MHVKLATHTSILHIHRPPFKVNFLSITAHHEYYIIFTTAQSCILEKNRFRNSTHSLHPFQSYFRHPINFVVLCGRIYIDDPEILSHTPVNTGDWMNVVQLAGVGNPLKIVLIESTSGQAPPSQYVWFYSLRLVNHSKLNRFRGRHC